MAKGIIGLNPYLEDVLVEVVLQALIGKVDAQLLEAVVGEVLEAKEVEQRDHILQLLPLLLLLLPAALVGADLVDPGHQPGEQGTVQGLGDGIPVRQISSCCAILQSLGRKCAWLILPSYNLRTTEIQLNELFRFLNTLEAILPRFAGLDHQFIYPGLSKFN